jgi:hypothetical protein
MNRRLLDNMLHQHQLAIAQVVGISASSVQIQISSDQSRHLLDGMNVQIAISKLTSDEANSIATKARSGSWTTTLVDELRQRGIRLNPQDLFIDPLTVIIRDQSLAPAPTTPVQQLSTESSSKSEDEPGTPNAMVYVLCVLGITAVALALVCMRRRGSVSDLLGCTKDSNGSRRSSVPKVQKIYITDTPEKPKNKQGSPKIAISVHEAETPPLEHDAQQRQGRSRVEPVLPLPPLTRLDPHGTQNQRIKRTKQQQQASNRVERIKPGSVGARAPPTDAELAWKKGY